MWPVTYFGADAIGPVLLVEPHGRTGSGRSIFGGVLGGDLQRKKTMPEQPKTSQGSSELARWATATTTATG
eukprot:CAMPEP_0171904710 /NCGR_PEP_ID=MMETSP0993-20121228/4365_1 /TAXON_ID=483369 /ORGANISM="non described non described, Strain CCMP2098" /LENGTH=70 /DNA_ID=CAMNT_0012535735 /DNA_START=76 /DNA_END=285 /DNA_ORIENTATION=-